MDFRAVADFVGINATIHENPQITMVLDKVLCLFIAVWLSTVILFYGVLMKSHNCIWIFMFMYLVQFVGATVMLCKYGELFSEEQMSLYQFFEHTSYALISLVPDSLSLMMLLLFIRRLQNGGAFIRNAYSSDIKVC